MAGPRRSLRHRPHDRPAGSVGRGQYSRRGDGYDLRYAPRHPRAARAGAPPAARSRDASAQPERATRRSPRQCAQPSLRSGEEVRVATARLGRDGGAHMLLAVRAGRLAPQRVAACAGAAPRRVPSGPVLADIALMTTELVTNAVLHGRSGDGKVIRLRARAAAWSVMVRVATRAPASIRPRARRTPGARRRLGARHRRAAQRRVGRRPSARRAGASGSGSATRAESGGAAESAPSGKLRSCSSRSPRRSRRRPCSRGSRAVAGAARRSPRSARTRASAS